MLQGLPLMFDWTISIGNALTIISFLAGGLAFVVTVRNRVNSLSDKMLSVETKLEQLVEILVQQGRHEERMNAMDQRVAAQGQRLDETIVRLNRSIDEKRPSR